jgi:hypothetical protein
MKVMRLVLIFGLAALGGCATRYSVVLTNGAVITAKGKPRLDAASHCYVFKDVSGKQFAVPSSRIREIAPESMSSSRAAAPFKSAPAQ